jgi:hypothetical protein
MVVTYQKIFEHAHTQMVRGAHPITWGAFFNTPYLGRLPKTKQRLVSQLIESVLAQADR